MAKRAVMIAIDSFHDGGAEINAVRLANALTKSRDVYFFELDPKASQKKDQLKLFNESVKFCRPEKEYRFVIYQNLNRNRIFKGLLKLVNYDLGINELKYRIVADFISLHNIAVVNTHAPLSNAFFEKVKKRKQFKLVTTLHGHYEVLKEELGREKYQKFVSKHVYAVDQFIYTTADQIKSLENFKVDEEKFSKVYYGFDFKPPQTEEKKSKIQKCIIVSRGIREKGWEESIKAIIDLNNKGYNLSLTIVGGGEEYDRLNHLEQRYSFLKFFGKRMDIPDILREHDLALLPTYYRAESFPNSIIEYLSCGLPVITSTIGAIPEMIAFNDELAGDTIRTSKGTPVQVEELSKVIQSYLDNPKKYVSKRKLAQKAALKFSIETSVSEYDKVFNKC